MTGSSEQKDAQSKWDYAKGMAGAMFAPAKYVLLKGKDLSKATVFGVKDMVLGRWVFRVDGAHSGHHNYNHLNINPKVTGVPDPHLWLPPGSTKVGKLLTAATDIAGPLLIATAVAHDSYKLGSAVYEDVYEKGAVGHKTAKTAASVAALWGGSYAGGMLCGKVGMVIGGAVGLVPGTICSMVFCVVGGAVVGTRAVKAVQRAFDENWFYSSEVYS